MPNTDTYKGIYAIHKYWGKKPFNEISKFIDRYTSEGDVVLDSFCGSGVTLIEALKSNRKCVGVDLNPIAIMLSKVSMTAVDIEIIKTTFAEIQTKLKEKINSMYEFDVEGKKTLITHIVWQNDNPIEVWYSSSDHKKKIRTGTSKDADLACNPS